MYVQAYSSCRLRVELLPRNLQVVEFAHDSLRNTKSMQKCTVTMSPTTANNSKLAILYIQLPLVEFVIAHPHHFGFTG